MPSSALAYFLSSKSSEVLLETIEIHHPSFSQNYCIVRNKTDGFGAFREGDDYETFFSYYPVDLVPLGDQADLDTGIRVDFGDLGELLPRELDRLYRAQTLTVKPTVIYRVYKERDPFSPLIGPIRLEASSFSFKAEGASFEASAPYANRNRTGIIYDLTVFYMLRGYLK